MSSARFGYCDSTNVAWYFFSESLKAFATVRKDTRTICWMGRKTRVSPAPRNCDRKELDHHLPSAIYDDSAGSDRHVE
jgi:hypothetical protein